MKCYLCEILLNIFFKVGQLDFKLCLLKEVYKYCTCIMNCYLPLNIFTLPNIGGEGGFQDKVVCYSIYMPIN